MILVALHTHNILVLNTYITPLQVDVVLLLSHAHYEHFYNNIVQIQVGLIFFFISYDGLESRWFQ